MTGTTEKASASSQSPRTRPAAISCARPRSADHVRCQECREGEDRRRAEAGPESHLGRRVVAPAPPVVAGSCHSAGRRSRWSPLRLLSAARRQGPRLADRARSAGTVCKTIRVRSNCALVCRRCRPASGTSSFTMRTDVAASDPPSDSAPSPRRRPIRGARGVTPPVAVSDPSSFEDGALGPLESDAERGMERGEQEPRNALRVICINDLQDIHIGSPGSPRRAVGDVPAPSPPPYYGGRVGAWTPGRTTRRCRPAAVDPLGDRVQAC